MYLAATAFVGLVLLRIQFAAIALILLGIVALFEYLAGDRENAKTRILPAVAVLLAAIALLVTNYAIAGLFEITPFRTFWRFADQERFAQWVSPFLMLLLELGSSPARRSLLSSYAGICGAVVLAGALLFLAINQIGSLFRLYMFMMFDHCAGGSPFCDIEVVHNSKNGRTQRDVVGGSNCICANP